MTSYQYEPDLRASRWNAAHDTPIMALSHALFDEIVGWFEGDRAALESKSVAARCLRLRA